MSVKQNVHLENTNTSASRLEGKYWQLIKIKTSAPAPPQSAPFVEPPPTDADTVNSLETEAEDEVPIKCVWKLSHCVHNILKGHGTSSYRPSDSVITLGIQLPPAINQDVILEGDGSADWMMIAEEMDEYTLAAKMSEVEAIEPRTLAEAKPCPN